MSNLKEALAQDFIFLHGDKKYSINAFFIEHLEDSMSTINERNHRKNPPYKCCDKEVDYSDDDFMEIYD